MATSGEGRHHRHVIVALASGAVLSLTALTAGMSPAVADPGRGHGRDPGGPVAPETTVYPQPVDVPAEPVAPPLTRIAQAPPVDPPLVPVMPTAPTRVDAPPPAIASPPQTQTVVEPSTITPPAVQTPALAPAPVVVPERSVAPATTANPPVVETSPPATNSSPRPAPRKAPPPSADAPAPALAAPVAAAPGPVDAHVSAAPSIAALPPSPPLVASSSALPPTPEAANLAPGIPSESATPQTEPQADAHNLGAGSQTSSPAVASSQADVPAAHAIKTLQPQTLEAPAADVMVAKTSKPLEAKSDPAPQNDVVALRSSVELQNQNRGNRGDDRGNQGGRPRDDNGNGNNGNHHDDGDDHDNHDWNHGPRQWDRDWVQYDEYYRPIICNPFRAPVRIVYIYLGAPRIVFIPPLARVVLEAAELAAYSFTAVVDTAANVLNTGANAAVGTFFGGGYYPGAGQPFPPPPPPLLRYDNVPVQVRYSHDVYQPFRVNQIVDVGDDSVYGERKVLLDGVTPAWGQWKQSGDGERQFEVHRTQQYPGLDEPGQGPLPGNYQLSLASDESASGLSRRDVYLMIAAVTTGVLSLGAVVLSMVVGRRRAKP